MQIPDPAERTEADQRIPDPMSQNAISDPVAFGLEYDPESGCYYEK